MFGLVWMFGWPATICPLKATGGGPFIFSIIFFFSIPALFNLDGPMGLLMMTVAKTMRTVSS